MSDAGPSLIVAYDRRGAIGRAGALPWHLPDDLRRFKALTVGRPVLMGYRTALSIGRALPGRRNLVLSRVHPAPFPGQEIVRDLQVACVGEPDLCVIGGGEVFALALSLARVIHATEIDAEITGADAYFPTIDFRQWRETAREAHPRDARHAYAFSFVDYRRRSA